MFIEAKYLNYETNRVVCKTTFQNSGTKYSTFKPKFLSSGTKLANYKPNIPISRQMHGIV